MGKQIGFTVDRKEFFDSSERTFAYRRAVGGSRNSYRSVRSLCVAAFRLHVIVTALRASCGFAKVEPVGEIFLTDIPQQVPAGVDCRDGKTLASSLKCGMRLLTSSMNEAI